MKFAIQSLIGLATLLQISTCRSLAYEFEVNGTMTYSPTGRTPFSFQLQAHVRDHEWAIFGVHESPTNRLVTELSSDGNYIYKLEHVETNTGSFNPDDYSQALRNSWTGEIHPRPFPYEIWDTEAIILFYAYASAGYLDAYPNNIVGAMPFEPRNMERREEESHRVLLTRNSQPPGLPSKMIFRVPFQYSTNAVFTASLFTNISNILIPLNVKVVRYYPGTTNILSAYEFRATRISDKCDIKQFKPLLPSGAFVTDFRVPHFWGNDPGTFKMTTNGWPNLANE